MRHYCCVIENKSVSLRRTTMNPLKMKTRKPVFVLVLIAAFLLSVTSCGVIRTQNHRPRTVVIHPNPSGKIPPGQMKKATGAKSAKAYAPGQNKPHKSKGKKK